MIKKLLQEVWGGQAIKIGHVRLLAQLCGVGAAEADTLMRLARDANQRGWWAAYGDTVPDWLRTYLDLEQDASQLWAYESGLMFGLFQTPAYAETITAVTRPNADSEELAKLVAFTLLRFADAETAGMNCVYLENAQGALYQERPSDVDRFAVMFEQLSESALSADASLELVASYAQSYRASEQ